MSVSVEMLITLKGFTINASLGVPLFLSSFLGRFPCLGVTESFSVSKSFWLTSDMVSEVRNLEIVFSPPISVIFALRNCGTRLQNIL